MTNSANLRQQLNTAIDNDLDERIKRHKEAMRAARQPSAGPTMDLIVAPPVGGSPKNTGKLVMLAIGDSWFDYPLIGNGPGLSHTDVIAKLRGKGTMWPEILSLAHFGETSVSEMSLPKQKRMIRVLEDPTNWGDSGKPDAILFSAGGNDIAGDAFCMYLNHIAPGTPVLNQQRLDGALSSIEASYRSLFAFRDRFAPDVKIFGHSYDLAIPDGRAPLCAGPWLKPAFDHCGWEKFRQNTDVIANALGQFRDLQDKLAKEKTNKFTLIDTQGTLSTTTEWANELHPEPGGFDKIADLFLAALKKEFPGRI